MKTETKTIYKCDFCKKLYQIKYACENHEKRCKKQPNYLRPCHECNSLKKVKQTVWAGYGDAYGNELARVIEVLYCEKIKSFIYPPSVGFKGNALEMEESNIEMPKTCEFFTKKEYF